MHKDVRKKKVRGSGGPNNKTIVMGIRQRDGEIRAGIIPNTSGKTLKPIVADQVAPGASVYTDVHGGYKGLDDMGYSHETVDHVSRYVDGRVHTNGLENFWALLKRGLHGTYVSVDPVHLTRYLDERLFTYNQRDLTDLGRFSAVLAQAANRRLTWAELTARPV
jgi:transposase-like protein